MLTRRWISYAGIGLLTALVAAGCTSTRLKPESFEGRTIAATAAFAPKPMVRHPLMSGRRASGHARDEQRILEQLQAHLRDAAVEVDLPARIAADLVRLSAAELGAAVTTDPKTADYVLDFRVYDYGLVATSSNGHPRFYIEARATLTHRADDEVVWRKRFGRVTGFRPDHNAAELGRMSEAALARVLEDFATYASERMQAALRNVIEHDRPAS